MADIDLGALKFKIGLDDSGLDKQIKDIQKKLQDTFNQEMSFKPVLTDIGKINKQLSEVAEKIKNANESASKVGNGKSNKKIVWVHNEIRKWTCLSRSKIYQIK